MKRIHASLPILSLIFIASCGHGPARLVDKVKEIPSLFARDTMFMERSSFWDRDHTVARVDSNRQTISFKPAANEVLFVTLRNMGGVPLKRDTIRGVKREPAELFLHTGTRDTNMHLTIESTDARRQPTDVVIYIRNRDSVYREFLFFGK